MNIGELNYLFMLTGQEVHGQHAVESSTACALMSLVRKPVSIKNGAGPRLFDTFEDCAACEWDALMPGNLYDLT